MNSATRFILALAVVSLACGCSKASKKDKGEKGKKTVEQGTTAAGKKITLPSGVAIQDLKLGEGTAVKAGDKVNSHATGWLTNGTKFWSSHDKGRPIDFTLRNPGGVIKGWVIGVPGMKPGGKRKIWIPSALAYGSRGRPPVIPPDADLIFEVEIIAIR